VRAQKVPRLSSPLRLERLRRGLSQTAVAEAIGTDQTMVSLCELGSRLSGGVFGRLAIYYACHHETLHRRMLRWRRQVAAPPLAAEDRRVA
jgi:transcriptional regulator with XRE-family HTH domain